MTDRKDKVADQLTYVWKTPDGRTLTGEYQYTSPRNKQKWEITQTEHLVLYHAAPLEAGEGALLDAAAQRSCALVGVPLPHPHLVVYLFPDVPSLMEQYLAMDVDAEPQPTLSGFGGSGRISDFFGEPTAEVRRLFNICLARARPCGTPGCCSSSLSRPISQPRAQPTVDA